MSGKSEQESIQRGQREFRAAVLGAMRLLGTNDAPHARAGKLVVVAGTRSSGRRRDHRST